MLDLYHTSPDIIKQIYNNGLFGSGLFFSDEPYYMGPRNTKVYQYKQDPNKILDIKRLPYMDMEELEKIKDIVKMLAELTGLSEEDAFDILTESKSLTDINYMVEQALNEDEQNSDILKKYINFYKKINQDDFSENQANFQFMTQKLALDAAKKLGYEGVQLEDEQGTAWLIDMLDKAHLLQLIKDEEEEEEE